MIYSPRTCEPKYKLSSSYQNRGFMSELLPNDKTELLNELKFTVGGDVTKIIASVQ